MPSNQRRPSFQWLFRSNLPRRPPNDVQKRNFFGLGVGIGEIFGVLTNPANTLRALKDSKRLLDQLTEKREQQQMSPKHTFSPLPGFFNRPAEAEALQRLLEGDPSFIILFGPPSCGKTALLRQVLCSEKYHVLHFDLRIAGFADISSLYMSLSHQIERYFDDIATNTKGFQEFEKEAWRFKHDRLATERRLNGDGLDNSANRSIGPSDIARLMELFQSSLLKYSQFQPEEIASSNSESDKTKVSSSPGRGMFSTWRLRSRSNTPQSAARVEKEKFEAEPPAKKMPVLLFDEAHRLPTLLKSKETIKSLLDSILVLTKQDRLITCIQATSLPSYYMWLSQLDILQHCKIMSIGDCSKAETRTFFQDRILPNIPSSLQSGPGLDFDRLYMAFGGKIMHWQDFANDYVHANGNFDVKHGTQFLQAHSLLNLHIIHSSQASSSTNRESIVANPDAVPSALGPAGRKTYRQNLKSLPLQEDTLDHDFYQTEFTAIQLLKVMSRLAREPYLSYFHLCREIGVRAVDGMVKAKLLDLRWTDPVTSEPRRLDPRPLSIVTSNPRALSSATGLEFEDEDLLPLSEREMEETAGNYQEEVDIIGPKLLPITPIMRFAMQEVVEEYEEQQSTSEYASLSDVDEY